MLSMQTDFIIKANYTPEHHGNQHVGDIRYINRKLKILIDTFARVEIKYTYYIRAFITHTSRLFIFYK